MALTSLGHGNVASLVEATIQRRGASGTSLALAWTSLAIGGVVLAFVSMFATWYSAVRTATAWYSGWMPPIALLLVIASGLLLTSKQFGLIPKATRVSADMFGYLVLGVGLFLLLLNLVVKGKGSFLLLLVLLPWAILFFRATRAQDSGAKLEIEQVALGLSAIGAALIVTKIALDSENLVSGYVWGLVGALVVVLAALAACQYLGILSLFQVGLFVALAISTIILAVLLVDVVTDGWPVLTERFGDFWSGTLRSQSDSERLGISQGLAGSFWIAAFVAVLAFPIGIAAAVYLEEYAPRDSIKLRDALARAGSGRLAMRKAIWRWFASRLTGSLDIVVRNLAGVPSVVYGLLGLFLFVRNGQSSLLAGGITLAILVLPIVIITSAEAIRAVPQSLREGAFGVGATKWQVIRSQVMPFAAPGILTGTLLSLARAVGEAAPLILVGAITGRLAPRDSMFASLDSFFGQFTDRFTAMPIVIVGWVQNSGRDAGFGPAAGAAIVVLLVFVILMNSVAVFLRNYFEKKRA